MKICIESQDDGTFLVGKDAPMGEGAEMGAMPQEMPQGQGMQPAASVDEALELARQLLQSDGRSDQEQVQSGYDKGQRQMPAKMGPGAVFGE